MGLNHKSLSAIIFDLDNTLVNSFGLILDTFNLIGEKYINRKFTMKEVVKLFGPTEKGILANLVDKKNYECAVKDFYEYYTKNHNHRVQLYNGVRDVLKLCKNNNIILCLNTGKGIESTLITLNQLKIKDYFQMIITGSDVRKPKPDPEGVNKFLKKFDLERDKVIFIGDSMADIKCAKNSLVLSGLALWDSCFRDEVLALKPDYIFNTVDELKYWIEDVV
jgi:phosphoglycolate phosphatase/pyrophosphatase PpaX